MNISNINVTLKINNPEYLDNEFDQKMLSFNWNVTKFKQNVLECQLNFTNPLNVSQGIRYDEIEFSINDQSDLFKPVEGYQLKESSKTLKKSIPRLLVDNSFARNATETS